MAKGTKIEIYDPKTKKWIVYDSVAQAAKNLFFETKPLLHYLNGRTKKTPISKFRFKVNGVIHDHKQARINYYKRAILKYQRLLKKESGIK